MNEKVKTTQSDMLLAMDLQADMVYEAFFRSCQQALYAYALVLVNNPELARESIQEVYYCVWKRRTGVRIVYLKAYLYKAVRRECLQQLKKERAHRLQQRQYFMPASTPASEASSRLERAELEMNLVKALQDLPEKCGIVFYMHHYEGKKYRQIAEALGISERTVENHLRKALSRLRIALEKFLTP